MNKFDYSQLKNPEFFKENRMDAHSDHVWYKNEEEYIRKESSFRYSLNGKWKFFYAENVGGSPKDFMDADYDCKGWDDINVPAHIQMEGYDCPQYANVQYPWDGVDELSIDSIPTEFNPTANYVKYFNIPEGFDSDKVYISFQGVESAMALWMNGHYVGYSEDTFTPSEFDLSPFIVEGENKLAVQVFKWASGSLCEDQDFMIFSGIFRDVYLYTIPDEHVWDVRSECEISDDYSHADIELKLKTKNPVKVRFKLYDACNALIGNAAELDRDYDGKVSANRLISCTEEEVYDGCIVKIGIDEPKLWSAEYPNLYPLYIEVLDASDNISEMIVQKIGVRKFEICDNLMLLNGKRIMFRGVNRHEFCSDKGRVPSYENTRKDIITMKQNNINAIRTSHYPNDSVLYGLCDEFGIYLIAENNMETHGTWDRMAPGDYSRALPCDRDEWLECMLDRVNSCYQRDKNHPAVLIWSCGNESFGGKVIFEMSNLFRKLDTKRPVHYEGIYNDRRYNDTSDIESQMYTPPKSLKEFLKSNRKKPFILCEYLHAMGNSCGTMHEYTELMDSDPIFQGGFIWDYIDQSLTIKDRYGVEFQAYGGDYGDRPNDGNFCGNGIVYAKDRDPSPKMQTVKYNYQNIAVTFEENDFTVTNKALFTNTNEYLCVCTLAKDGVIIEKAENVISVEPLSSASFSLPFDIHKEPGEYAVTVSFLLKDDTLYAKKGHEIAFGQKVYKVAGTASATKNSKPRVVRGWANLGVKGDRFEMIFSGQYGGLVSYKYDGREMIQAPPAPNFWRTPNDNDIANLMPYRYAQWKIASMYASIKTPSGNEQFMAQYHEPEIEETDEYIGITYSFFMPTTPASSCTLAYTVYSDGLVKIKLHYDPIRELCDMPEFGVIIKMDADYDNLKWYGNGPEETYSDRITGSRLGIYEKKVTDLPKYLMPQECGMHTGVRYAYVTDNAGHGLKFMFSEDTQDECGGMYLSALPYSPHELENALHSTELPSPHYTYVRAAKAQMGIAGDNTWGATTHPEYLIDVSKPMDFEFSFIGC